MISKFGFSLFFKGNALKNAFRFENQNITWTHQEFESHSNAFAYGLLDQGYKPGDKLLYLLGRSNTSEAITSFIGAAKAGVISVPFRGNSLSEIEAIIKETNPKGIVFSPNQVVGDKKFIELIQQIVPESKTLPSGAVLKSRFSNLQYLVHTGFYSYPGTYKYREILTYASKNFNRLALPTQSGVVAAFDGKTFSIEQLVEKYQRVLGSENVIISGDPQTIENFALGDLLIYSALGAIQKGYYAVYTGSDDAAKLSKILPYYKKASLVVDKEIDLSSIVLFYLNKQLDKEVKLLKVFTNGDVETAGKLFQTQAAAI